MARVGTSRTARDALGPAILTRTGRGTRTCMTAASVRALTVVLSMVGSLLAGAAPAAAEPAWRPTTDLSAPTPSARGVRVAADRDGNATAVWESWDTSGRTIQTASRPAGGAWSAPVTVSGGLEGSAPDVVVDVAGDVTVAWLAVAHYAYTGGPFPKAVYQVRAAVRSVSGTWSEPTAVSAQEVLYGNDPSQEPRLGAPRLVVDSTGTVTAAWSRWTAEGLVVDSATRSPDEEAWSASTTVAAGSSPSLGVAPDGDVTMVWPARTDVGTQLRASSRPRSGAWTPAVDVSGAEGTGYDPDVDVAVDGAGTATTVWRDDDEGVVLLSSRPAGGAWTTPVPLSTMPSSGHPPRIAADADGHVWAVWAERQGETTVTRAAGRNPGGDWAPPVDLTAALDGAMGTAALAASAEGDFVFVGSRVDGSNSAIVSLRTIGATRWGRLADIAAGDVLGGGPDVAVDAAGNAVAAWVVGATDRHVVQAAGLDASGPVLGGFSAPGTGVARSPLAFGANAHDVWSPIGSYIWTFGDGGTANGADVTHAYTAEGSYVVSLTVTDGVGNSTTRSARIDVRPPDLVAPRITRFYLTRPAVRVLGRALPRRTKLVVRLTTEATVKLVFKSKHKYRASVGRRYHRVVIRRRLPAGRTALIVRARVGGEELRPDTYLVTGRAVNAAGASPRKRARLQVVDPSRS